ncbi:Rho termination factor N-terminal domain-containing protein [Paenibacillus senegalimassiliensis]|uniref:Rho termination factor N-terminal domain-containing protein n=1 Tax=Paenibacillus senegalimassiliensis TaxID=1737426 RepID=UPI00073EBA72|nr:Rho termination factor N-terminal domain-containing protein [Paenibacillus senegalimassiliensis]
MSSGFDRRVSRLRESVLASTQEELNDPGHQGDNGSGGSDQDSTELSFNELRAKAKELAVEGYGKMNAEQLQEAITAALEV